MSYIIDIHTYPRVSTLGLHSYLCLYETHNFRDIFTILRKGGDIRLYTPVSSPKQKK